MIIVCSCCSGSKKKKCQDIIIFFFLNSKFNFPSYFPPFFCFFVFCYFVIITTIFFCFCLKDPVFCVVWRNHFLTCGVLIQRLTRLFFFFLIIKSKIKKKKIFFLKERNDFFLNDFERKKNYNNQKSYFTAGCLRKGQINPTPKRKKKENN